MTARPRDYQRSKVYTSERDLEGIPSRTTETVRGRLCTTTPEAAGNFVTFPCKRNGHTGKRQANGSVRWYHYKKVWAPESLRTVPECQAFVDAAMSDPSWTGPLDIYVTAGRAARWATARYQPNRIVLPLWARVPIVICHELAHHLAPMDVASHGPEFTAHMLRLVYRHMGVDAATKLAVSFREHGVDVDEATLVGRA